MNDDQLAHTFRQELHALLDEISPSEQLLDAISPEALAHDTQHQRQRPKLRPRLRRTPMLIATTVAVAAIAAVFMLLVSGRGTTAAYAVTVHPGGSVTVTLRDLTGIKGANEKLAALGVRARVVPMTAACRNRISVSYLGIAQKPAPTIRLIPRQIPKRSTVVLAARSTGSNSVEMAIGKVIGPAPSCVSSHGVGPGLPGWRTPKPSSQAKPDQRTSR